MENYSYEDFLSARRRAENEAREMFARSFDSKSKPPPKISDCRENRPDFLTFLPNPISNLLGGLFKDNDTMLILALIIILASDKADKLLIFALIYIMM